MDEHALADLVWKWMRFGSLLGLDVPDLLELSAHLFQGSAQVLKHMGGDAFALDQQPEQ